MGLVLGRFGHLVCWWSWIMFDLHFGFLAKENIGYWAPRLKTTLGVIFSIIDVNFDEIYVFLDIPDLYSKKLSTISVFLICTPVFHDISDLRSNET